MGVLLTPEPVQQEMGGWAMPHLAHVTIMVELLLEGSLMTSLQRTILDL